MLNDLNAIQGNNNKELRQIESINENKIESSINETEKDNRKSSNFEYFDILELLDEKKMKGEIRNKEEETFYIIELQNREEELIENGELCSKCKAIGSIRNGKCLACEEKNAL